MKKNYKSTGNLVDLIKELAAAKVKFIICGGVACVLHGVERSTYDIDIYAELENNNLRKIINVAEKFSLMPRIPEPVENLLEENIRKKWITEKNALVFTFFSCSSPLQMDLFLTYPIPFDDLYKNADLIKIGNTEIAVCSKKDLLFAKKIIEDPREKDILDIKELKRLINEEKTEQKQQD